MLEWIKTYAFVLWLAGGAILGTIHPVLGGLFMLGAWMIFIIHELISDWRRKG